MKAFGCVCCEVLEERAEQAEQQVAALTASVAQAERERDEARRLATIDLKEAAGQRNLVARERERAEQAEQQVAALTASVAQAAVRAEALDAALREYGDHQKHCPNPHATYCECGWNDAIRLLAHPEEQQ